MAAEFECASRTALIGPDFDVICGRQVGLGGRTAS